MCACCTLTSVQDCLQCRAFPQGPVRICNNLPKHQSLAKAVTWELQEASSDDVLQSHFIYGTSDFLDWPIGYCISHNFSLSLFKIGLWLHPSGLLTFFSSLFQLLIFNFSSLSLQGLYPFLLLVILYLHFSYLFFLLSSLQVLFGDTFKYCKYKYIPNGAVGSHSSKMRAFHCSVNIWIRKRNQKLGMLIYVRSNLSPCLFWSSSAEGKIT